MMPQTPPPAGPPGTPMPSGPPTSEMHNNPNFRPRDVFEVFKEGFSTTAKVFPTFLGMIILVSFVMTGLDYLFSQVLGLTIQSSGSTNSTPNLLNIFSGLFITSLLLQVISRIIFSAAMSTFVYISFHYQKTGELLPFGEAFQRIKPKLATFIILDVLMHFIILLTLIVGLLLLVFPALFALLFAVWWSVSLPVLFDENKGVFDSMSRSKDLVQGFKWHVLGYILLINIIDLLVSAIIPQLLFLNANFNDPAILYSATLIGSFLTLFIDGIDYMARPVLYMDVSARQEQRIMLMSMYTYQYPPAMGPPVGYPAPPPAMGYSPGAYPAPPGQVPPPAGSPYQYPAAAPYSTASISTCQNCGSPLEPNAKFCPSCGTPIVRTTATPPSTTEPQAALTCKSCGHPNPEDALFCENCGTRLR